MPTNKEVNQQVDEEFIEVKPTLDGVEDPNEYDPIEVPDKEEQPALSSEAETEKEIEEKPSPEPVHSPAPVEGETPRERALRLEVQRLKAERRKERAESLGVEPQVQSQPRVESKVLDKYDPEELNNLREVFDVIATEKGYVRKDEFQVQSLTDQLNAEKDAFLERNPQYLPENDKDDVLWNRLQQEVKLYKSPATRQELKEILERANERIMGIKTGGTKEIAAQKEKLSVASHSGRQEGKVTAPSKTVNKSVKYLFKGFSEDELTEMFGE